MDKIKNYIFLHLTLLTYAISNIFSKLASNCEVFSFGFILYLGLLIFCLGIYAILWQQVLKKMDLTLAYANKGITVFWSLIISITIFKDNITVNNIFGCLLIVAGIIIMAFTEAKNE